MNNKPCGSEVFEISGRHGTYIESRVGEFADSVSGEHNVDDLDSVEAAMGYLRDRGWEYGFSEIPLSTDFSFEELVDYVGAEN